MDAYYKVGPVVGRKPLLFLRQAMHLVASPATLDMKWENDGGDDDIVSMDVAFHDMDKLHEERTTGSRVATALAVGMTLTYALAVILFARPNAAFKIFDESWMKHGFSIQNMNVPFRTSFDWSFGILGVSSGLLAIAYMFFRTLPALDVVNQIIPPYIVCSMGHGFIHGLQALLIRHSIEPWAPAMKSLLRGSTLSLAVIVVTMFWIPIYQMLFPRMDMVASSLLSALTMGGQWLIPVQMQFVYVQTGIYILYGISQFVKSGRRFGRIGKVNLDTLFAYLVMIPSSLAAWMEATGRAKSFGGHILYDGTLAVSSLLFYVACAFVAHLSKGSDPVKRIPVE